MFGKWLLGKQGPYLPQARGFHETWRQTDLYAHKDPEIDINAQIAKQKGWPVSYLTDRAIEFMTADHDQPWFTYLAYPQIHEPYFTPESLVQKYQAHVHSQSFGNAHVFQIPEISSG